MRPLRRPATALLLLVLVTGVAFFAWRLLDGRSGIESRPIARAQEAETVAASDARAPGVERTPAGKPAEASATPEGSDDVVIEPTPEHGVPVVVVARGSGEPRPFALVTRISFPWDERADERSHRDVDWLLDHLGRRFRADEHGFVRIPPAPGRLELFARVGGAAGYAPLDPGEVKGRDDAPPKRIEVAPLAPLRVRVVDPDGVPVAGIPLQVACDGGGRILPSVLCEFESTAPDGLAEVRGASLLIDDDVPPGGLRVFVGLPLRRRVSLSIARAELDGKPRTLVVPATGRVELVLVDEHGNVPPFDGTESVSVLDGARRGAMTRDEERRRLGYLETEFKAGRALLPFVEVGAWIEADLDFAMLGAGFVQAAGPTVAGTTVRIDVPIRPRAEVVALRGRVVDREGRPIARRRLVGSYLLIEPHGTCGGEGRDTTRADGSFEIAVRGPEMIGPGGPLPPPAWDSLKLTLSIDPPEAANNFFRSGGGFDFQRRLELGGEIARHGGDLGTIALDCAPRLASGVVLDDDGAPAEHVRLELVQSGASDPRLRLPAREPSFDTSRPEYSARSGPDGQFEITGDPGAGIFGLQVIDDRYLPLPPIPIEPGAAGLRIVVGRPASLKIHVLVDPGVPPSFVFGRVRIPRDGDASHDDFHSSVADERGDLVLDRLLPRTACVEIFAFCFGVESELVARFDAVPLAAGERTVDPRLQTIDLRGRFTTTHLVVVDPDGRPIPSVSISADPVDGGDPAPNGETTLELGAGDLVTHGNSPSIEIEAEGFRTQRAVLAPPETRITLRRGIAVVVELDPSVAALPESCFYAVSLERDDFSESLATDSALSIAPDAPREIRVERPGERFLQLWLVRYVDRHSMGMDELKSGRARIPIEASDEVTTVHASVTEEDVKATLKEMGL